MKKSREEFGLSGRKISSRTGNRRYYTNEDKSYNKDTRYTDRIMQAHGPVCIFLEGKMLHIRTYTFPVFAKHLVFYRILDKIIVDHK